MRRQAIESAVVRSAGYDPRRRILEIEFPSGAIYHYYNVPEAAFEELMRAESKGRFLNARIRRRYPFYRMFTRSRRVAPLRPGRR